MGESKNHKLRKKAWMAQQKHQKSLIQLLKECKSQKELATEKTVTKQKYDKQQVKAYCTYYSGKYLNGLNEDYGKTEKVFLRTSRELMLDLGLSFEPDVPQGLVLDNKAFH